ncbi:MAG TPA: PilZ domain-containing protein [Polyangiaceae bacterium]|jgi:hypothetical protein|nr:PilZ domain-containing protein [Polyangiaceae bacterium]
MPESYPELNEPTEDTRITLSNISVSRRLGVRTPMAFGVYATSHGQRVRARAAELSTTGVVLDFRHSEECSTDGLVTLELFVPGHSKPIRTAARFVRRVGKLLAFEFVVIGRDERLSLAEHIDRVHAARLDRVAR